MADTGGARISPIAPKSAPPMMSERMTVRVSTLILCPTISGVMKPVTMMTIETDTIAEMSATLALANTSENSIIGTSAIIGPTYGMMLKIAIKSESSIGIGAPQITSPKQTVTKMMIPSMSLLKP